MRRRLRQMRWRIALAAIGLVVGTLIVVALILIQILHASYLQSLELGLAGQARLVALMVTPPTSTQPEDLHRLVIDLERQLHSRVTLIGADGHVLADSLSGPDIPTNVANRPEVRDALQYGQGTATRYITATGDDMFLVAIPAPALAEPIRVIRVGVPLTAIAQARQRIVVTVATTALAAAGMAILLAILIARQITLPLHALRAMANRLAAGEIDVAVPLPRDEAMAELARDFNAMASQVRQLIASREAERQRLATILMTMGDGILLVNAADQVSMVNPAAEHVLSTSVPTLPVPLLSVPVGQLLATAVQRARSQEGDSSVVLNDLLLPESAIALRAIVTCLPPPHQDQAIVVLQDFTDLRKIEEIRRTVLTNVSHDLRTPIASLQAMVDTLADGALDDRAAALDFLGRMDAELHGLNRLVNDLLELSRLEAGDLTLHCAPTALAAVLATAASRLAVQVAQHGLNLTLDLAPDLPPLLIDGQRMEQVFLNILQNAIAFTPAGGAITIRARWEDPLARVQIIDTGIGIAPEDLPHIFQRFYKADRARRRSGAGVGLSIVRALVRRHGGTVFASSPPHGGTTITVLLPANGPTLPDGELQPIHPETTMAD